MDPTPRTRPPVILPATGGKIPPTSIQVQRLVYQVPPDQPPKPWSRLQRSASSWKTNRLFEGNRPRRAIPRLPTVKLLRPIKRIAQHRPGSRGGDRHHAENRIPDLVRAVGNHRKGRPDTDR